MEDDGANREPSLGPDFHAHESQSKFARWLILVSLDEERATIPRS